LDKADDVALRNADAKELLRLNNKPANGSGSSRYAAFGDWWIVDVAYSGNGCQPVSGGGNGR